MDALLSSYEQAIAAGGLKPDAVQHDTLVRLAAFARHLRKGRRKPVFRRLGNMLGFYHDDGGARGFYLYGGVGRGKTMVMDLFYAHAEVAPKRRVHFHAFMLEVHDFLHDLREKGRSAGMDDALMACADHIAAGARLLCFDEFQVRDVADAMILGRLFTALFARGVHVVLTSNIAPDDLYADGLQRDRFLPFIALLKQRLQVVHFDGGVDYRLHRLHGQPVYFTPADDDAARELDRVFDALTDGDEGHAADITVKGRKLHVPRAAHGVAMFHFEEICGINASAVDYLALARDYRFVIVADVPKMDDRTRDRALRFVTLVDTLYDHHRYIALSAAVPANHLYRGEALAGVFERTVSRLDEMQSQQYRSAKAS